MIEKIKQLREEYIKACSEEEKNEIKKRLIELQKTNYDDFEQGFVQCIQETTQQVKTLSVRQKMEPILPFVSVAQLSKFYFNKSKEWFYQRINGNIVNGKPAKFTEEELVTLNFALQDISKKIGSVSV